MPLSLAGSLPIQQNMGVTRQTRHALGGADTAWVGVARRAGLMQIAQLTLLLAAAAAAIVGGIVSSRSISHVRHQQEAHQAVLMSLYGMRDRMQQSKIQFVEAADPSNEAGIPSGVRLAAQTAPVIIRAIADQDAKLDPGGSVLRDALVADATRVARIFGAFPRDETLAGPAGRRFSADLGVVGGRMLVNADAWMARKDAQLIATASRAEATANRQQELLWAFLALVAVIGIAIWVWLGGMRSRFLAAIQDALARLADRAARDQLTGLPGHAAFQERLSEEFDRATATGGELSLVLIDLDHFKQLNDSFGHPAGDEVLQRVAALLADGARHGEFVARVGGEEFAWLLPGADASNGYAAAERMRQAIARAGGADVRVTASAGVCEIAAAESAADLYRLADGALYWAKAHGRDVTFQYSADVVEELSVSERAERLERLLTIGTVRALARAVDAKDPTTQQHSERVAELARRLAQELGWTQRDATALYEAGLVHDVGKIGVPDAVLFKHGPLEPAEIEQIRAHSALGAQMVTGVLGDEQVLWVRWHHERLDGSGYPDGLVGDEIPEGARILALADAWDAMTSERPYSDPLDVREALAECRANGGVQFWEPAIEAVARLIDQDRLPNSMRHAVESELAMGGPADVNGTFAGRPV